MSFFNELGKKLSQAGQDAAQQTKMFAETTKISSYISDEEKRIDDLYKQIGKSYFEANRNNGSDIYAAQIAEIVNSQNKILEYQQQIRDIKGIKNCPNCGAELNKNSGFCSSCGYNVTAAASVNEAPVDTTPINTVPAYTIPVPVENSPLNLNKNGEESENNAEN